MLADRYSVEELSSVVDASREWVPYPRASERAAWEALPGPLRNALVERGRAVLADEWPSLPADLYLRFARDGDREAFQKPYFARRTALGAMLLAAAAEAPDAALKDAIGNAVWSLCEETSWCIPAHVGGQGAGVDLPTVEEPIVDLFAAETGGLLAWTEYLAGDLLDEVSPQIRRRLRREVEGRILRPCLEADFGWHGFHPNARLNNWTPWINSNWLTCILLMEEAADRRAAALHRSLRSLDRFLEMYPPDGGCDEGPGYWGRAAASLFECLALLHGASGGAVDVFGEPLIGEMGRFVYRAHIAGAWFVNFADAPARLRPDGALLYRYGKAIGDEPLQGYGAFLVQQAADRGQEAPAGPVGRALPAIFLREEMLQARGREPLPREVWLPQTELLAARAAEGSTEGFFLAAKGGHNAESHNHNDIGQFILYRDGRPVIIDVGVETYRRQTFSPDRYSIWTMQSGYHNLPAIDGTDQAPGLEHRSGAAEATVEEGSVRLSLEISPAYPPEAKLQTWRRELHLERPATLRVRDHWTLAADAGEIALHLLTPCEVAVTETEVRLAPRDLPCQESTGAAVLSWHGPPCEVAAEAIELTDARLASIWGERVHRLCLRVPAPPRSGSLELTFGTGD